MKKIYFYLITIILVLQFSACNSIKELYRAHYTIEVNSLGSDDHLSNKKYILFSDNESIDENDLEFIEYANYINALLSRKGYIETNNIEDADIAILLGYDISGEKQKQQIVNRPIEGVTGVKTKTTTSSIGSNNEKTTTSTTEYGTVGYQRVEVITSYYNSYLFLKAIDFSAEKEKAIWEVTAVSSGDFNDLRRTFPFLVIACEDYIGKSSGQKVSMKIFEDDKRLSSLEIYN